MTTLFRSRQRADEFAALVDGATPVRRVSAPGTERLVGVAQLLRAQGSADEQARPRDDFAADLRERLMTEAATVLTAQNAALTLPPRTRGRRERRLVAAASAVVLLGGTAGMATAAQSALPGDALYPVKRGIEKAEAGLSLSSAGRGRDLLQQAGARLDEAQGLIDQGSSATTPQVPRTLASFTDQAREGADLLLASYRDSRDPRAVVTVRDFAAARLAGIEAMSATAPAEARPGLRDAAHELQRIDAEASRLCVTCSDLPALRMPQVLLASAEVDRAMQRLQDARLDNSHPVIVPKQDVRRVDAATGGTGTGGGSGSLPSAPKAPSTSDPAPELPGTSSTPEVKVKVDVNGDQPGGNLTGNLGEGLGDVVETLLPDTSTDLLP